MRRWIDALSEPSPARLLLIVLSVGFLLVFYNLGHGSLQDWDEALTAERAREILVFQDWLTIYWGYVPSFVKPPLYYWLTALTYQGMGVSEFAARLWSALFGVLGLYAVYRLGTLVFTQRVGVIAAALLLTVTYYVNSARTAMLDTGLLSFGVLALCALLSDAFLLGWVLLGVGFMIKGPWVFFYLLPLPLWWLVNRRWEALRNPRLYLGVALFLAIVLPWHLIQYALYGQIFVDFYVGYQMLTRMQQAIEGHQHELLFYLKKLSDKWHIWSYWFVVGHFVVGWRGADRRQLIFFDLWILAALLMLTFLVQTKITEYAMVFYPAMAVVVAYFIVFAVERLCWGRHMLVLSILVALIRFPFLYDWSLDFNPEVKALGQIAQRHAQESQPVLSFQAIQPSFVFYCRRPIYGVGEIAQLLPVLQPDSLLITNSGDTQIAALEQQGFVFRVLYDGPRYTLMSLQKRP